HISMACSLRLGRDRQRFSINVRLLLESCHTEIWLQRLLWVNCRRPENNNLLIASDCFDFFQVAGLYRNRWRFSQEYTQSLSETGAKIIDVTRSALFYFISSRELH
ncbi:MAG TPA: hypothetical protein VIJ25_09115, partial [Methylococcales bacterium]